MQCKLGQCHIIKASLQSFILTCTALKCSYVPYASPSSGQDDVTDHFTPGMWPLALSDFDFFPKAFSDPHLPPLPCPAFPTPVSPSSSIILPCPFISWQFILPFHEAPPLCPCRSFLTSMDFPFETSISKIQLWGSEMTQWLKAQAALASDLDSVLSTHIAVNHYP